MIPMLGEWSLEDQEFKISLSYMEERKGSREKEGTEGK